ncbi:MAG: LptF/LptG family permease [Pseudomonadota bacterium]
MALLDRYILRSIGGNLLITVGLAAMVLILERMLRLFDFVIAEHGPADKVWQMLVNLFPHYIGLALPIGAFLSVLFTFRKLSQNSELDAVLASGVSFSRLLRPVWLIIALLMATDFALVGFAQPFARYQFRKIEHDIVNNVLAMKIPQGEFVKLSDNVNLRFETVNSAARTVRGIFVELKETDGAKRIISAQNGTINATPDNSNIVLQLKDTRQIFIAPDDTQVRVLNSDTLDLDIPLSQRQPFRNRGGQERELTLIELWRFLNNAGASSNPDWSAYRAEYHWRLIHFLTYLALPFLAIAAGVSQKRSASTARPVLALIGLIAYYELFDEWATGAIRSGALSPYASIWLVYLIFAAACTFLFLKLARAQLPFRKQNLKQGAALPTADALKDIGQSTRAHSMGYNPQA